MTTRGCEIGVDADRRDPRWRCAHRTHHVFGYVAYPGVRITPLAAMSTQQVRYLERLVEVPPNLVIADPWRR